MYTTIFTMIGQTRGAQLVFTSGLWSVLHGKMKPILLQENDEIRIHYTH